MTWPRRVLDSSTLCFFRLPALLRPSATMLASSTFVAASPALAARAQRRTQRRAAVGQNSAGVTRAALSDDRRQTVLGMDASEGIFGFKPFPELLVGRLAMMGFTIGVGNELITGLPILRQIGIASPSTPTFEGLLIAMGGATLIAGADTMIRLKKGTMTKVDAARYKDFVANPLGDDELDIAAGAAPLASSSAAASEATTGSSSDGSASPQWVSDMEVTSMEAAYAREVELTNGRWAMLGFAAAILIEAATGDGVIGQGILYAKVLGLLGPNSGFF